MLAQTNTTGIILVALGALAFALSIVAFVLRNRARGKKAEVPNALRPGPADARARDAAAQPASGLGRRADDVLRDLVPVAMALRAVPEPQPGERAPGARRATRSPGGAAVFGGQPARGRLHPLPRQRAEGRRDPVHRPDDRRARLRLSTQPDHDLRGHPRPGRSPPDDRQRERHLPGDPAGARRHAVVEHPVRGRPRRPADQRHRHVPDQHQLAGGGVRRHNICTNPAAQAKALALAQKNQVVTEKP